jgi:hypothetical protein
LSSNSLPDSVKESAAVTNAGYAYVIGGYNTDDMFATPLDTVYYTKLNADGSGSVGAWQTATNALPAGSAAESAVVSNGYVYVLGGQTPSFGVTAAVHYAKLNADGSGSVGAWQTATSLPVALQIGSSVVNNGYIYVLGGNSSSYTSSVYYAKLNADGSLGAWQTGTSMPQPNQAFNAIAYNGYLYDIGGTADATYYAALNADGSVGTWQTASNSPGAIGYNNAVLVNGYVYLAAGYDSVNNNPLSTSKYAKLNADGSVGTWQTATGTLPYPIWIAGTVAYNGHIYELGGGKSPGVLSTVFSAPLNFPATSTTIPNAANSKPVSVTTPTGTVQTCANPIAQASIGKPDGNYTYPIGLVGICYYTNDASDQIKLIFVTDLSASQVVARDYNSTSQTYTTIPGAVVTSTTYNGQAALQVTYDVTDNGVLDSDATAGVVNDPVGLALAPPAPIISTAGVISAPNTGYGTPAMSNVVLITVLSLSAAITTVTGLALLYRQKHLQ